MKTINNCKHRRSVLGTMVFGLVLFVVGLVGICNASPTWAALDGNRYDSSLDGYFRWPLDAPYTAEKTAKASENELWQGTFGIPSLYGCRISPSDGQREGHDAIDIWAKEGTPVYAAAGGYVRNIWRVSNPADAQVTEYFGNSVVIDHQNGYATRYNHLSAIASDIIPGGNVQKGQLIGKVGHTGAAFGNGADTANPNGDHLDFAIVLSDPNGRVPYCDTAGLNVCNTDTRSEAYVGQTNPLYYFGNDIKKFANDYYGSHDDFYGCSMAPDSGLPVLSKDMIWTFPKTSDTGGGGDSDGDSTGSGNGNKNSNDKQKDYNQDLNTDTESYTKVSSFKGTCRSFLGLTSWDCGLDIKDQDSTVSGIPQIAVNVITDIIVVAAYLVIIYVIYGGYLYMFSAGDPGKAALGQKTLSRAFIGLGIVMSAFLIMSTIRYAFLQDAVMANCATNECADPSDVFINALQWAIGVCGIVAAAFIVYGGILYTTSAGDSGKLQKAKSTITYALIGLVIVALAEIITAFVSNMIRGAL